MTKEEWASLLDSLRDDDGARSDALLMLSDEDWVREGDRVWLREAARRRDVLRPARNDVVGEYEDNSYWVCHPMSNNQTERPAKLPGDVVARIGEVDTNDRPTEPGSGGYTAYQKKGIDSWRQLLEAIS